MKYKVNTESEWLKLRGNYVTASEAAVLVGLNPYSSPSKLKAVGGFSGNSFTMIGQLLEPIVLQVTNKVMGTGFKLYEDEGYKSFFTRSKLGATPDATNGEMLLECKTTRPMSFLKYKDVPPVMYLIQVMVQLFCTKMDEAYLSIMSTDLTQRTADINWPVAVYKVTRDDRICEILKQEALRYYKLPGFRVDSKKKKEVVALLDLCYSKVYG